MVRGGYSASVGHNCGSGVLQLTASHIDGIHETAAIN
jgi:hypothetical protein